MWDEKYLWIKSIKLIDFQIVRNRGSLRMVGSTKISNGYPLIFDNEKHKLTDSLIKIYFKDRRDEEQLITSHNINPHVFENILEKNINQSTDKDESELYKDKPCSPCPCLQGAG